MASFAERLTDTVRRLDELHDDEDRPVRAAFMVSYANLVGGVDGTHAQFAFRALGLWDGPDMGLPAAAALLGWPPGAAERALEALLDAHLVEEPVSGRYRLHDLLHVFAAERADDEMSPAERTTTVTRLLDWYLHTADQAAAAIAPHIPRVRIDTAAPDTVTGFADPRAAFAWYDTERLNLAAAARQAITLPHEAGWKLPLAMRAYTHMRARWEEATELYLAGVDAAGRDGDKPGENQLLNALGVGYRETGRYDAALEVLQRGLACCVESGDQRGEAATTTSIANTYRAMGDSASAIPWYQRSLRLRRALDDQFAIAATLNDVGQAHYALGRYAEAIDNYQGALSAARAVGHRNVEAAVLDSLGEGYGRIGELRRAVGYFEEAIRICRGTANLRVEAIAMDHLAQLYSENQLPNRATEYWRQALAIFESLDHPAAPEVRRNLDRIKQPT
jgi:tetratricopeptide (TPR) repeat protein